MKDIEPILQVLSNYLRQDPSTDDELEVLRSWLREAPENEKLFDEISHKEKWEKNWPGDIPRTFDGGMEEIRRKIIENLEEKE